MTTLAFPLPPSPPCGVDAMRVITSPQTCTPDARLRMRAQGTQDARRTQGCVRNKSKHADEEESPETRGGERSSSQGSGSMTHYKKKKENSLGKALQRSRYGKTGENEDLKEVNNHVIHLLNTNMPLLVLYSLLYYAHPHTFKYMYPCLGCLLIHSSHIILCHYSKPAQSPQFMPYILICLCVYIS